MGQVHPASMAMLNYQMVSPFFVTAVSLACPCVWFICLALLQLHILRILLFGYMICHHVWNMTRKQRIKWQGTTIRRKNRSITNYLYKPNIKSITMLKSLRTGNCGYFVGQETQLPPWRPHGWNDEVFGSGDSIPIRCFFFNGKWWWNMSNL